MRRVIIVKSHPYDFWNGGKGYINILNLLNMFLFQDGLNTLPHDLPLQITWTDHLPKFSTLK